MKCKPTRREEQAAVRGQHLVDAAVHSPLACGQPQLSLVHCGLCYRALQQPPRLQPGHMINCQITQATKVAKGGR